MAQGSGPVNSIKCHLLVDGFALRQSSVCGMPTRVWRSMPKNAPGPSKKKRVPQPRRRQQPVVRPRPRARGGPLSLPAKHELWHPAMSGHVWVPRSLQNTPLVRVRDYTLFQVLTGGNPVVILVGPCLNSSNQIILGQLGVYGAGATAANAGSVITSTQFATYGLGRGRMHRIGVTVSCLGPTAAGVLLPNSYVRMAALRTPITPANYSLFSDIATSLTAKSELHTRTGYDLMSRSAHVCASPLDFLDWQQLKTAAANSAATYIADDSMSTIAIVLSAGTTADTYNITIHADYDYLPSDEATTLIGSAAVTHPSMPERVLEAATSAANTVAGVFEGGERIAAAATRTGEAVLRAVGHMPSSFPALTGRTWGPRLAALGA